MFQGLPSWVESVAHETLFGENKIVRRFCTGSLVGYSRKNAGVTPAATVPVPVACALV
jgi:hypothetical protein